MYDEYIPPTPIGMLSCDWPTLRQRTVPQTIPEIRLVEPYSVSMP